MDKKCYNKILSLLLFPKRTTEQAGNYLSFTNGFLWRRDAHRLVAFRLQANQAHWDYPIENVTDLTDIHDIQVDEKGILTILTKSSTTTLSPVTSNVVPNALNTLFMKNESFTFSIPSKELSKQLSILQRKIMKQGLEFDQVTLTLQPANNRLWLPELKVEAPLVMTVSKGKPVSISFSFAYFRDLLINCNKFHDVIHFKTHLPFFTAIQYDHQTFAVLLHKKD